ncbi:MAG: asparaginase [Bdellovibrionota bacterium]
MKSILILHTGGTFGMSLEENQASVQNSEHLLENLLRYVPEIISIANIDIKILCNIDSSNATPEMWIRIATTIYESWNTFDGFVVIHGTDTMAWSSSAVAYFLKNLTKPVVFTGSQRPLTALRNDARSNIIDAVELATYGIPEVMLCFESKVHRATRATKYSNEHLHAFKSYNSALLGRFGVNFKLNKKISRANPHNIPKTQPILNTEINSNIMTLIAVPGIQLSAEFINNMILNSNGIIIKGFGVGTLSTAESSWLELCRKACDKKIPVVMATQCESGFVNLNVYENSKVFADLGVMSSLDMTFEAVSVKLMVMLGRNIPFEKRHEFFATPLAFEC